VRGYLIATQLGDSGVFGTLELRSPSFIGTAKEKANEWRVYGFVEGGQLYVNSTLPGRSARMTWPARVRHALPLSRPHHRLSRPGRAAVTQPNAVAHNLFLIFRLGVDF
jgi:hypothetical protein